MHTPLSILKKLGPILSAMIAIFLFGISPLQADSLSGYDLDQKQTKFSGFLTLGAVKGGSEYLGFRRNVSQEGQFGNHWSIEPDTLLGLQIDTTFTAKLSGAIQYVGRDRVNDDIEDAIEWAYLRYRFNPALTLRAGRIGLDLFMLSEYRNLGFAYLWARPPVEFYGSIAFDHYDGFDILYSQPLGDGTFEAKLFGGKTESTFAYQDHEVEFILTPSYGFTLSWENETWHAKLALADLKFDDKMKHEFGAQRLIDAINEFQSNESPIEWSGLDQLKEDLDPTGEGVLYHSLGLTYDNAPWIIHAEAAYIKSNYNNFQNFFNRYLSVGYRIGPTTVYAMGAQAENTKDRVILEGPTLENQTIPNFHLLPPAQQAALLQQLAALEEAFKQSQQLHDALQFNLDDAKIDQRTFTLGLRWDIHYNLALKAQFDRSYVEGFRAALWASTPKGLQTKDITLDTYSINLNFVF